ncbi:MAG: hypothetical protein ACJAXA_000021 [Candidatus Aldehydirespiratoraceae bacterium]|jgi:hypothetical protein
MTHTDSSTKKPEPGPIAQRSKLTFPASVLVPTAAEVIVSAVAIRRSGVAPKVPTASRAIESVPICFVRRESISVAALPKTPNSTCVTVEPGGSMTRA